MALKQEGVMNRVDPINALRTFTILVVFIAHTNIFTSAVFQYQWSFILETPAWMAMWILFPLSGYLAGKGFLSGKYPLTPRGIGKYYYRKILRIWLPTLIFIFLLCVLAYPDFLPSHPDVIGMFLSCTYGSGRANPAVDGVGATWFVFTLMWMYFAAPLLAWVAEKIRKVLPRFYRLAIPALAGLFLLLGLGWRLYAHFHSMDWNHYVYCPPYANFDLFATGLLLAYFQASPSCGAKKGSDRNLSTQSTSSLAGEPPAKGRPSRRAAKAIAICGLLASLVSCCYLLYHVWPLGDQSAPVQTAFTLYQYVFPTVTALLTLLYLYGFGSTPVQNNGALTAPSVAKNPARLIDAFAVISFEFYLFHSAILNRISSFLRRPEPLKEYLLIMIAAFVISLLFAVAFHYAIGALYKVLHLDAPIAYLRQNHGVLGLWGGCLLFLALCLIVIKCIQI